MKVTNRFCHFRAFFSSRSAARKAEPRVLDVVKNFRGTSNRSYRRWFLIHNRRRCIRAWGMLKFLLMQLKSALKTWFGKMWALALLAVISLVASPAFASACCCDDMGEVGHSHASPSASISDHQHFSSTHLSNDNAQASIGASVGASCDHQRCEVSSPVSSDSQNKVAFASLVAVLPARFSSLHRADARIAPRFHLRVSRSCAPDRWSSSGLSPPALTS